MLCCVVFVYSHFVAEHVLTLTCEGIISVSLFLWGEALF